jgi:DNA-binding IscR family transcriptional regulator
VIAASDPSWIARFTGLSPRQFRKLVTALRREGADPVRKGRPWELQLEDRVLLVATYWRTNLTLRQLAPLFGISKSAADRIIGHLRVAGNEVGGADGVSGSAVRSSRVVQGAW